MEPLVQSMHWDYGGRAENPVRFPGFPGNPARNSPPIKERHSSSTPAIFYTKQLPAAISSPAIAEPDVTISSTPTPWTPKPSSLVQYCLRLLLELFVTKKVLLPARLKALTVSTVSGRGRRIGKRRGLGKSDDKPAQRTPRDRHCEDIFKSRRLEELRLNALLES